VIKFGVEALAKEQGAFGRSGGVLEGLFLPLGTDVMDGEDESRALRVALQLHSSYLHR
jgi:hypothetical protein